MTGRDSLGAHHVGTTTDPGGVPDRLAGSGRVWVRHRLGGRGRVWVRDRLGGRDRVRPSDRLGGRGRVWVPVRRGGRGRGGAAERGGATICVLAVGLVIVLVGLFGAALGAARTARQQARVAADFGALAGAARALGGEATACAVAGELTGANGARLAACRLDGLDVLVTTEVEVTPLPWLTRTVTATSRAGPVRG